VRNLYTGGNPNAVYEMAYYYLSYPQYVSLIKIDLIAFINFNN